MTGKEGKYDNRQFLTIRQMPVVDFGVRLINHYQRYQPFSVTINLH